MPDYPPSNFQRLKPSRKPLRAGDIFTMRLTDGRYLFGRVVRTDADCFAPGCILVYVFRYVSAEPTPPDRLLVGDLLIPPHTINRLGWSRGYLQTIANRPFEEGERLRVHYFHSLRRGPRNEALYVDEDQRPVPPPPSGAPVGVAGLGNYRTLEDMVSQAMGLPRTPD